MYAVVEIGGKQYIAEEGASITHERLAGFEAGKEVEFEKVLLVVDDGRVQLGNPYLDGAKVVGHVQDEGRGKKITVYKYKSKKGYRRKQGHRQPYAKTLVTGIES